MSSDKGTGNEFIDTIVHNNDMSTAGSVPEVQHVMMLYAKNLYDRSTSDVSGWRKMLVIVMRLIHMFGIIFICSGWLLPSRLLIIHILFCLKTIILWKLLDGKCYMSMITNRMVGREYSELIPMNIEICKSLVVVVLLMSVQGVLFPKQSYFKLFSTMVDFLKKFD